MNENQIYRAALHKIAERKFTFDERRQGLLVAICAEARKAGRGEARFIQ